MIQECFLAYYCYCCYCCYCWVMELFGVLAVDRHHFVVFVEFVAVAVFASVVAIR